MQIKGDRINREPIKIDESIRRKTNTTLFLLPCLGLNKGELEKFGFVNAYIGDSGETDYGKLHPVYLLFEHELDVEFNEYIDRLCLHELYVDDYDVSRNQVMVVLKFPKQWSKEYNHFMKGEYSKFNKKYVEKYFPMTKKEIKNGVVKTVSSVFAGIFNKESWLKEYWEQKLGTNVLPDEYWSVPESNKEIFRYKSTKQ